MRRLKSAEASRPASPSHLTKINIPGLSTGHQPPVSLTHGLGLVVCFEMWWQTSHFRKTTTDHFHCATCSQRPYNDVSALAGVKDHLVEKRGQGVMVFAGRPRAGCNPSKWLTESLPSWNQDLPPTGRTSLACDAHRGMTSASLLCWTWSTGHISKGGHRFLAFSYFVCISSFSYCCFHRLAFFGGSYLPAGISVIGFAELPMFLNWK